MYFDLAPKEKIEDLYDFEDLFRKLTSLLRAPIQRNPLIVVKGVRRAGKTSLIKTALNELGLPYLYVNGKRFADMPVITKKNLLKELELGVNEAVEREKRWTGKFLEVLRGVEWLKVDSKPPFIHFEWRRPSRGIDVPDLIYSFQRLSRQSKTRFVLVLDEAQEFKRLADYKLQNLISDIYDHRHEIQMIVSGSQAGLLDDFLEIGDPEAPLFGRGMAEVAVSRLSADLATNFLRKGCKQAGVKTDKKAIELVVSELDGVIGWLTFFGYKIMSGDSPKEVLARTVEEGSKLEAQELEHFLKTREQGRKRYVVILKSSARLGPARWTTLKANLQAEEGKKISDKIFSALLENLVKANFLDKKEDAYFVPDPLLIRALQKGLVR